MKKLFKTKDIPMKYGLTLFASLLCLVSYAQKNSLSVSKSINDDGKVMSINVNGYINGKAINYNRSFNISGFSKQEREDLRTSIYESLGINTVLPPDVPQPPAAPGSVSSSSGRNATSAVVSYD